MPPRPLRLSASSFRSSGTQATLRTRIPLRSVASIPAGAIQQHKFNSNLNFTRNQKNLSISRAFSSTPASSSPAAASSSGKSQADLIVEELQELYEPLKPRTKPPITESDINKEYPIYSYETATDELEIATESTDSATIYAASDRESARDALNSLVVAYDIYTASEPPANVDPAKGESSEGEDAFVELSIDPAEVPDAVKEEVKKRVGQRVREVKSAVEVLESRAHD